MPDTTRACCCAAWMYHGPTPPDVAAGRSGHRGGDPEYGEVLGDLLELLQRCMPVHRYVRSGPGCDGQVATQDRRSRPGLDLFKVHSLGISTSQYRPSAGRTDVLHPARLLAEHRHQVALAFIVGDDHWERNGATAAPPSHLQRRRTLR